MEYRELPAEASLAADLACVWYDDRRWPTATHSQLVLPDGCVDIVWIRGHPPIVAGPATMPVRAETPSQAALLGVRFRPGRAPAFLGLPADALLNSDVPLGDVWGDAAERLLDELERTTRIEDGLRVLQAAVRRHSARGADPLVASAVATLNQRPDTEVRDLGDTLGVSERQLLRRFTTAVGYGPRTLGRVLRFRRFLGLLADPQTRGWDLTRLAAEAGFADHAHLDRECSRLAGSTPSVLRTVWA